MPLHRLSSGYSGYLSGASEASDQPHARSDTFYGRLGSTVRDRSHEVTPTRRVSFSQLSALRKICVRLTYDEDAYPGGIDIDMFALLFDNACAFVDCIFYKHPEDASGSFSLNQKTNSLAVDLETVPDSCHTIVLAAAVYTTGMSIAELEGGLIEICEGFMGPVLFSIPLQSLEVNLEEATDSAGVLFFSLSEFGGKWRCRRLERFSKPELPSLMKVAKEESQQIEEDFAVGNLKNLRTLDYVARTAESSPTMRSSSSGSREAQKMNFSINSEKLEKLQSRLSALRGGSSGEGTNTEARLSALEDQQKRLSRQLSKIEDKLDLLLEGLQG
ncbi:hypothetical protein, conserved [Eimeria tenella]|uniref:TerD domain-containing protein n=1 Tax=Eimeria tenella TaxID=5802 RepID=U6L2K2_EIMTE|nr:hypothetical protein, conserved [Eimeria tenella]CDJ42844.1 hypothetical protein, conserved [Eimeria tenella]|eukprot:XP_013233594.1 hypothetical protein, conserved [Eimeria tenella]